MRTRIDLAALARNLRRARAALPEGVAPATDLSADAWGHGRTACAAVLREAGFSVDPAEASTVAPEVVWGLDATALTEPVMRAAGIVLSTKALRAGEGVSYGYLHRAPRDTRIALVTGGYAQGVVRSLGGRAVVVIDGLRHPIVGRVAMDVCVVDIGDAAVDRGAEAVFFGDPADGAPSVREWVTATGMTAIELVAAVGVHSEREHVA
ncbi:alanine racemase [Microbacterium hominis]|uniref:Alanine racemase n=1 Tax=Microbacterium hominis TaxID=162426 RepID=A0A7D4UA14_9MICO|nr:alanine racemase [Microbacterium hominis]